MKILHTAAMLSFSPGIYKQMTWENQAAINLNISLTSKIFCPVGVYPNTDVTQYATFNRANNFIHKTILWVKLRKEYFNWLEKQQDFFDLIILRYSVHDIFLLNFLKNAKVPIYLVHHTLELPELEGFGALGKFRALLEKIIGNTCLKEAHGLICVTDEIKKYELSRIGSSSSTKPIYIYPNGILSDQNILSDSRDKIPEILFVASYFFEWHGLDLLLQNIKNSKEDFILNIVGRVDDSHKNMVSNDNRVIFHGLKNTEEIRKISEKCWVGLSSFALYRKGMNEACTLKVREYLNMGLPVYSGHKDVFPEDFDYYMIGEPNISKIIAYAKYTRFSKRDSISEASEKYINKQNILLNLYNDLSK